MKLYYIITIIANIIVSVVFYDRTNFSVVSVSPILLMILSISQAAYFNNHRRKKDFNINNDSPLTEEEWAQAAIYIRNSYMIAVPLFIPFILFFSMWIKLLSLLLYFAGVVGGMLYYRIRNKDTVKERYAKEDSDLKEQMKKEELGKWK